MKRCFSAFAFSLAKHKCLSIEIFQKTYFAMSYWISKKGSKLTILSHVFLNNFRWHMIESIWNFSTSNCSLARPLLFHTYFSISMISLETLNPKLEAPPSSPRCASAAIYSSTGSIAAWHSLSKLMQGAHKCEVFLAQAQKRLGRGPEAHKRPGPRGPRKAEILKRRKITA